MNLERKKESIPEAIEISPINREIISVLEERLDVLKKSTKKGTYYYEAKYDGFENGLRFYKSNPDILLADLNNKRRTLDDSIKPLSEYEVGFDDGMREVVRTVKKIREEHDIQEELEIT